MAQPYVGEIRMFAGNFAPAGWMFCEGQLLPISEYETLFNLIGTTYGGDGQSTFALPDLRGRIPIHQGNGFVLAETGGGRGDHADREPDPRALASVPRFGQRSGQIPARARADKRSLNPRWRPFIRRPRRTRRCRPCPSDRRAEASRTITFSRIFASTTLFRSSGFSRRRLDQRRGSIHGPICRRDSHLSLQLRPERVGVLRWADLALVAEYRALLSLLGTTYGGDGKSNFALPDFQGNAAMHPGQGPGLSLHDLGETGGSETVSLLESEIPSHSHGLMSSASPANRTFPAGNSIARAIGASPYVPGSSSPALAQLSGDALAPAGGGSAA